MLDFPIDSFMCGLQAKLPRADVKLQKSLLPEQKLARLALMKAVNSRYKHGSVLGYGALYGVKA